MDLTWQTIIAAVSALAAVAAAIFSLQTKNAQRELQKWSANYAHVVNGENFIKECPKLLELHGITETMLKEADLSPQEVLYLINSFRAGDLFYRLGGKVKIQPYRAHLLAHEKVRTAWRRILRDRFVPEGEFRTAVDDYIKNMP